MSLLSLTFFSTIRPARCSSLFPYTTLFRSKMNAGTLMLNLDWRSTEYHAPDTKNIGAGGGVTDTNAEIRWWDNYGKRSEEHTSELQSRGHLVCRLLLEKKKENEQHANNEDT